MTTITFQIHDGSEQPIEAETGIPLMEAAVENDVPGIDGDCGGMAACATCHVYVDEAWCQKLGERTPAERAMLENSFDVQENSRLACQIPVTEELDGLRVEVAPS
ncbi:2Fe-2S iron-sulfur cluster-binding protein [Brevibacterium album]|uniref:2Fe-2S iron-sulfur cluster-binding protein n=1 Tax=Brevibacterium album TaxID=417948 RepID=UPI000427F7DC|nr:2Fe-2S iron-sulfur cluster-binding protein [Brevibacterium album]